MDRRTFLGAVGAGVVGSLGGCAKLTEPSPTATQVPAETTAPPAAEDAPTDAPATGPGFPWWLLLLVLAGAVAVGGYGYVRQR